MSDEQLNPLKTICDLKWNYPIFMFNRAEFRSCCRTTPNKVTVEELQNKGIDAFLNSDHMLNSRLDLIKGVRNQDCRTCWKIEDAGAVSPRSEYKQFWQQLKKSGHVAKDDEYDLSKLLKLLKTVKDITHPILRAEHPRMLEISLGNTCDMKCMYCNHHYSTQWAAEKIKFGEISQEKYDREFPKQDPLFIEKFWEWFMEVGRFSVERIGIIGGEPLIMPEFYDFMERLIKGIKEVEHKREKQPIIWIVTNLNTPPAYMEKFIKYLETASKEFKFEILASMESLGARAEYIRNGINWNRFEGNIHKLLSLKDINFNFGFILSQNILSITNTKEVIQFIENLYFKYGRPISIKQSIVTHPTWQNPTNLTPDFARYLDETVEYMKTNVDKMPIVEDHYGRYDWYINYLSKLADAIRTNSADLVWDRKMFASWYDTYDKRRNLNLLETFPEYRDFYNLCKTL